MSDIAQKIDTRFRKAEKVRVKAEFDNIYKNGKRFYSTNFVVIILKNHLEIRRVGIVVTKKTGKAFRRNRIKRILREFFRLNKTLFPDTTDTLVLANRKNSLRNYQEISEELCGILTKICAYAKHQ